MDEKTNEEITKLRSGLRWREKDEVSAGYLKRTIATRRKQRNIENLVHPATGDICSNNEDKLQATEIFYKELFTPEMVENEMIQQLVETITPTQQDSLSRPFSFDSVREQAIRSLNPSSPGPDGLRL
ncbi:hypothetical protein HPULCUR_006978 [Helicostylum pulchrum]|uniref:Reverse transcriptase n=1 Tax=Helicostylum pulchrum TaxID=562976 RepID=A0ABP9Y4N4_9FUNG